MKQRQAIWCCGAAGTGKTVVAKQLIREVEEVVYKPSVARDYFKLKGIESESVLFTDYDEAFRKNFQMGLMDYYFESFENFDADIYITDRSPLDHLAYVIYNTPSLTLDEYYYLRNQVEKFTRKENPLLCLFPYPQPWSPTDVDPDNFRYASPGKNLSIQALIEYLFNLCGATHKLNFSTSSSISARVYKIVGMSQLRWGDFL